MPFVRNGQTIVAFQPVVSCVYNPKSRGFDLMCKKGHGGMNDFLKVYAQPIVVRPEGWHYYVSEVYWKVLFEQIEKVGFALPKELREFYKLRKEPPWVAPFKLPVVTVGGTTLRPYQETAVQALHLGNLILGDDMGLGKTLSVIHSFSLIREEGQKLVVITPNDDVAGDWIKCINEHFAGMFSYTLVTSRDDMKRLGNSNIVLIPYSKVWRAGYVEVLAEMMPQCILVPDEGHRISRVNSKQHKGCYDLALRAMAVWVLSGTEVSNTPDQYYGMYRVVRQPDYSDYKYQPEGMTDKAWVSYFRDTTSQNQWHTPRLESLRTLREGFALRRTKEEVQKDLPPLTIVPLECTLDPVTRKIYRDLEVLCQAELMRQGNPEVLKEDHFWTIYLRLIQICSHPMLLGEERVPVPNKWERVEDLIGECSGAQKIGIWSNFPRTIEWVAEKVREAYPWLVVATAHGGVSKEERKEIKEGIQAGQVDVVVANPAIWSEGVNLQAISCGIYWDLKPSLVQWRQSQSRFHRMGQTKNVTIYLPTYTNTVEVKILEWLEQKTTLARLITGN